MRPAASIAALALLLGACTVQTEGAPCQSDANCPSGQGCGADGRCSASALSCPGHTAGGECTPGATCDVQGDLVQCTAGQGVCSTRSSAPCPAHQSCVASGGTAACGCDATRCSPSVASYCASGDARVTCAQDSGNPVACWYPSSPAPCAPAQACVETGGTAICQCPAEGSAVGQGCATQDSGSCAGTQALRCLPAASGSPCMVWTLVADCAPAGQACTPTGCQCPPAGPGVGQGCVALGAGSCAGTQQLRCTPVTTGSACLVWQSALDCGADGLVCTASGCQCPAAAGATLFADAVSGSPLAASPPPSGAVAPARCRFSTLADALAAASAAGGAVTVKATGWTASLPDGVMTFAESGPLALPAGVTLSIDESPVTAGHYAIAAPAGSAAAAFLTVAPGATLSGFVVRNVGSTADGVATSCGASPGTATIRAVRILGTGAGSPPARFRHAVHHTGGCSLALEDSHLTGAADTGLFVENVGASTSATILRNVITGNDATTEFLVGGANRRGGGMVLYGTLPPIPSFVFQGNLVYANQWDQVLAYTVGQVSLAGGAGPAACGTTSNFFGCYAGGASGVGISSVAASLDVSYDQWWLALPPVSGTDYVGTLTGTNLTCPAALTCPP